MTLLRRLLSAPISSGARSPWALYDDSGRLLRSGTAEPPQAMTTEAVLAASAVRIVALRLPPISRERLPSAAAFALEDQLAGPAQEQHLALLGEENDGQLLVAIAARELVASLRADFARVIAECAVAPVPAAGHWGWYMSGAEGAFVRKADGSAFATSLPRDAVPPELALTLEHARREGLGPTTIDVAFGADDAGLAAWTAQCGVSFVRGTPWRWENDAAMLAAAADMLQGEFSRVAPVAARGFIRSFRLATAVAVTALAVHVLATVLTWGHLRFDAWQTERALLETASAAGIADVASPSAATVAIAKKFALARHRAGMYAPGDAIPLLARAAPGLSALAAGSVKTIAYTDGQWLVDFAKIAAADLARLEPTLAANGLATLAAPNAAGTRMRFTLAPGEDRP